MLHILTALQPGRTAVRVKDEGRFTTALSASMVHDRGYLAAPLSVSALFHSKSVLPPKPTTHAHNAHRCADDIYHTFSANKTELTLVEANGVDVMLSSAAINKIHTEFCVNEPYTYCRV